VVTRWAASKGFEAVFQRQADALRGGWRSASGRQWLVQSGYEEQDALELRETLLGNARRYQQYDEDGCTSDDGGISDDEW